jgi:hypothetical protein
MVTYAMAFKNGKDILHKTQQSTLKQATEYFAEVKQMPIKDFKKIFIVIEVKQ